MVRTVIGDEAQVEAQVDSIFVSHRPVQVGILIGKLGVAASRDSVFALIPTPSKDGEEAVKIVGSAGGKKESSGKKGTKAKPSTDSSSAVVDTDWVAEHARQVSRMLVGGMEVVGVFIFATENAFKNSSAVLGQAVRAVATASPVRGQSNDVNERLLLHISSSPRRVSCRSCVLDASLSTTGLRPCDWKTAKLLSSLHTFVCSHPINIRLPVLAKGYEAPLKTVRDNFLAAIAAEAVRLKSASAFVDGLVPSQNKVLGAGNTSDKPQVVELLSQLDGNGGAGDIEGKQNVEAIVTLSGVVEARAYASTRESLERVILDLKEDIISSLKSRLDLLSDDLEQKLEDAQIGDANEKQISSSTADMSLPFLRASGDESAECNLHLPCRVYVPWHGGALVCDYLLHAETVEDVKDRCIELLSMSVNMNTAEVLQPESSEDVPRSTFFPDLVNQNTKICPRTTEETGKLINSSLEVKLPTKEQGPQHTKAFFGAVVSLFIAILLAWLAVR